MRVLVNAVAARLGGGASHLTPFLLELLEELPEAEMDAYVTEDFQGAVPHPRLTWQIVDVPAGVNMGRLLWDNIHIARRARHYDVVLSPLNFGPMFTKTPHVLFQRNAVYFDPRNRGLLPLASRARLAGYRWLAIVGSNLADSVVVPSNMMADLVRGYLWRTPICVAPHRFEPSHAQTLAKSDVLEAARNWARADIKLLHVGHPGRHKGMETLARTLAEAASTTTDRCVALAVTFGPSDSEPGVRAFMQAAELAGVLPRVHFLGSLQHEEVFPLYRAADVLLLPSSTESFGFPILEAFAVGTPVVATDHSAIREVSGGLAALHPYEDAVGAATLALNAAAEKSEEKVQARIHWSASFSGRKQAALVASELRRVRGKKKLKGIRRA
jgi:glycosyltransferase involved in cell wall biosynthesis